MFRKQFLKYWKTFTSWHSRLPEEIPLYADDANILGGSKHTVHYNTIKKKAEDLVVASKETGLEVNADKTKYMVMSGD